MSRPRLGFLGVGWIGRDRMQAMLATGEVEAAAVADASPEMVEQALALGPETEVCADLGEMLKLGLDGVVIATPSALHAEQSIQALRAGAAVFCQKPLGRDAGEVRAVVEAARAADRLLGVDLSYRSLDGARAVRELVQGGELGTVFAADLTFHNAYGPDKPWFYDPKLSGGGCVIDLGVHLVDLALWTLGFPVVERVTSRLYAGGRPLGGRDRVEDYAVATLELGSGATVRVACSWKLNAGCDAVIDASFYGPEGAAALKNLDGSFYDFRAERWRGSWREGLAEDRQGWGGRAAADWARRLARGERFDPGAEQLTTVAEVLDRIYAGG